MALFMAHEIGRDQQHLVDDVKVVGQELAGAHQGRREVWRRGFDPCDLGQDRSGQPGVCTAEGELFDARYVVRGDGTALGQIVRFA